MTGYSDIEMSPIESLIWVVFFYLAPSVVAFARRSSWRSLVVFVNVVFGWTIVGWFVAWFLAFHRREERYA